MSECLETDRDAESRAPEQYYLVVTHKAQGPRAACGHDLHKILWRGRPTSKNLHPGNELEQRKLEDP